MQQFQATLQLLQKPAQSRGRAGAGRLTLVHDSESGQVAEKEGKMREGKKV